MNILWNLLEDLQEAIQYFDGYNLSDAIPFVLKGRNT